MVRRSWISSCWRTILGVAAGVLLLVVLPGNGVAAAAPREPGTGAANRQHFTLPELERRLDNPDMVARAMADLEAGKADLHQLRNDQGVKVFAGTGAGYTVDTSLTGSSSRFTTYDIRAGLRYPLLGLAAAEERGVVEAETSVRERQQRLELARRQAMTLLRRQYVALWSTSEKLKLTEAFLANEVQQTQVLARRLGQGYILDADYQEMLTVFDLAHRTRDQLKVSQAVARRAIERLVDVNGEFSTSPPLLPAPCANMAQLRTTIEKTYPTVTILRERLRGMEHQAALVRHAGPNARMDVYSATGNDDFLIDPEYSVGVAFVVEMPVGRLFDQEHPAGQSADAQVERIRRELTLARDEAFQQAEEALGLYQAAAADLRLAERRLRAGQENLRERQLRTAMEGDALEQLHRARDAYYKVQMDQVDARVRGLNYEITLLEFAPETSDAGASDKPAAPASVAGVNAIYVWNSARFQEQEQAEPTLRAGLRAAGINRVLLSLNRQQMAQLEQPDARKRFADWLRGLHQAGLRVELLLGEPLWILPAHRGELINILGSLADLPFTGLHLDIEPHQLTTAQARSIDVYKEWLATLGAAKKASPWPLGVSVHPRYFDNGQDGWSDFGLRLAETGVFDVVLMMYASNPDRVFEVTAPIMRRWPALRFGVAQSVEPELGKEESHFLAGRAVFNRRMDALVRELALPNFTGITIQDWSRWQEMGP